MTDLDVLTLTLYGEARGEPIEGLIGVAMVIRNRVLAKWRGALTYEAVCLAPKQFSCWEEEAALLAAATRTRAQYGAEALEGMALCEEVAQATIAGTLADNTGPGATHYLTAGLYHSDACPAWARGIKPLVTLGHQVFLSVG